MSDKQTTKSEKFELADVIGVKRFTGVLLAESDTRDLGPGSTDGSGTRKLTRWTELALYLVTEGDRAGTYVLETVGRSDVFHQVGGVCKRGERSNRKDLLNSAVACWKCKPGTTPNGVPLDEYVAMETDRSQVFLCTDPAEVKRHLTDRETGYVSVPALSLLKNAAEADTGIYNLLNAVEDI